MLIIRGLYLFHVYSKTVGQEDKPLPDKLGCFGADGFGEHIVLALDLERHDGLRAYKQHVFRIQGAIITAAYCMTGIPTSEVSYAPRGKITFRYFGNRVSAFKIEHETVAAHDGIGLERKG